MTIKITIELPDGSSLRNENHVSMYVEGGDIVEDNHPLFKREGNSMIVCYGGDNESFADITLKGTIRKLFIDIYRTVFGFVLEKELSEEEILKAILRLKIPSGIKLTHW